jgi:hypothetical protein
MKHILLLIALISFNLLAISQTQNFKWAKQIGGSTNDAAYSIDLDSARHVYSMGVFTGTVDLDPGPNTYSIAATGNDAFIVKLDSNGNFMWGKSISGALSITIKGVVDKTGNVYVTGVFQGILDLDPGLGVYTLSTSGNPEAYVAKLDSAGNFLWAKQFMANSVNIATDVSGNVFTTGDFYGTVDFDPGTAAFNLIASMGSTYNDAFISKLDNNGNFIWAKQFGGLDLDEAFAVTTDVAGNVYTTGCFTSSADFDPGPATYTLTGSSTSNIFISKLDMAGNFVWAKGITGPNGKAGHAIKLDLLGNVFVAGNFSGTADFDPSASVFAMATSSSPTMVYNIFIEKLDNSGNFIWAKQIGGSNNSTINLRDIAVDKFSNIYSVGEFGGNGTPTDFDPGPWTYNIIPNGSYNMYMSKLDANGNFVSAWRTGLYSDEIGYSVKVDTLGSIFLAGKFFGISDFDPGSTGALLYGNGEDAFVMKMGPCFMPQSPVNTTPVTSQTFCPNSSAHLSAASTGTLTWHSTPTTTVVLGTGNNYTTPVLSAGSYTYYAQTKGCMINPSRTPLVISANPASTPTVTVVGTNTVCSGSGATFTLSGCLSYSCSAATSTITGNSLNILSNYTWNYSVSGTNSLGCVSVATPIQIVVTNTCADVWPGDVNSDGLANNFDFLELGIQYLQIGPTRTLTGNNWQVYTANSWSGNVTGGKNLSNADCNGDGIVDLNDTLAIHNNYGLSHVFRTTQTTTVNPQMRIVPDQAMIATGVLGSASIYLGDSINQINYATGVAFTLGFDHTLIDPNSVWLEFPTSYINTTNQNIHFRKLDFNNDVMYAATTHTNASYSFGSGKIALLHYKILSGLTTNEVLNLSITAAKLSEAGNLIPLTSGTGTLMAIGASVGLQELSGSFISVSPNPTNGSLTINSKTELQKIEVISITGQVLFSETPTNVSHILHLDNFSNGIYFVNIYQDDQIVKREKIVLSK